MLTECFTFLLRVPSVYSRVLKIKGKDKFLFIARNVQNFAILCKYDLEIFTFEKYERVWIFVELNIFKMK